MYYYIKMHIHKNIKYSNTNQTLNVYNRQSPKFAMDLILEFIKHKM